MIAKLIKAIQFYSKAYDNLLLIGNWPKLFSSIPKHMIILCWSETDQSYSVLFQKIWQSYVDHKLIKAVQFYSKTYDNLTMIRNFSKVLSSIPKDMTIWHWSETYQGYSVLFQNTWESYVHWKLIRAIQFCSKTYDNLTLIRNLTKLLSFSSIPKHMTISQWSETSQRYWVLFQKIWQSDIDRKLIKAIQFYSKTHENLTFIGNLSELFSSVPKHMTILL